MMPLECHRVTQPLAIVIPAYKARFLTATLQSIAAQTNRRFVVYVGDDASPDDLAELCRPWAQQMDLRYHRFDQNLGGRDLIGHWHRCIGLGTEPWVWLFSDDDVMSPACVERLLQTVEAEGDRQPLLHFNVDRIDAQGQLLLVEPEFPALLSSRAFAIGRLRFSLSSYAPDYAFQRARFVECGGFQPFPLAWCSDDATWIKLASERGIRTLSGAKIGWRRSGDNISSRHTHDAATKVQALAGYLRWLDQYLLAHPASADEPEDDEIVGWFAWWFSMQLYWMQHALSMPAAWRLVRQFAGVRGMGPLQTLGAIGRSRVRGWREPVEI